MEDSLSNASYMPDAKAKQIHYGDLFRHDNIEKTESTPKNIKAYPHNAFSVTINTPQTSMNFLEKRSSFRTVKGGTDSVETVEKSDRTVKPVKPYNLMSKAADVGGIVSIPLQMANPLLKKKSQGFTINSIKQAQSPVRRELFANQKTSLPLSVLGRVPSVQKPIKMVKKEKADTHQIISDLDAYKQLIEKAKKPLFEYSECINFKKHRVNVQESHFGKSKTKQILANFSFQKKERVVGNIKDKIGKNKKIIQYEAKALKSTNSQDINNFRTQLKLIHLENKNDYFFVEVSRINEIYAKRQANYQAPSFKSKREITKAVAPSRTSPCIAISSFTSLWPSIAGDSRQLPTSISTRSSRRTSPR
jgi:hypothetical protein